MGKKKKNTVQAEAMGVPFTLNRDCLSDCDTLEALLTVQDEMEKIENGEGDEFKAVYSTLKLARFLFGQKQWDRIKKDLRKVDTNEQHFVTCIKFIFEALDSAAAKIGVDVKN